MVLTEIVLSGLKGYTYIRTCINMDGKRKQNQPGCEGIAETRGMPSGTRCVSDLQARRKCM